MTVLDINEIKKILPHRYPMLLVDRILEIEPMKRAVGIKNITANEMQFLGHFPNEPIMPGVLLSLQKSTMYASASRLCLVTRL